MRIFKTLFLFIMIIILSSCSKTKISIYNEILDEKQVEKMKIDTDLIKFDDFEIIEDYDWLIPLALDEKTMESENKDIAEQRESKKIEKELLKMMKEANVDINGMNLVINKNGFLVFWNKNIGKIYLYDTDKKSLQFLLDTYIVQNEISHERLVFLANTNENTLYLANESYLYLFNHEGRQMQSKKIPENFNISTLRDNFGVLTKEGKLYIYLYSSDSIKYVFQKDSFLYYYNEYLILQKGNMIYCIDFLNNKIYPYKEENIESMQVLVIPGSDKITIIDNENLNKAPKKYKIRLPKL
ncbi:hypothetical protein [Tissierella praeacuta]|uniref:hypothetical protein n=1 Tax=Tissierella praeacuta TaxID=43131 RepID=UPI002FD96D29